MHARIADEPRATLDYAVVAEAATLQPITHASATARILLAVRVGAVRLIDNAPLG